MRKNTPDTISIIAFVLFSVFTVAYGLHLQITISLHETELQNTQKALQEFQKSMAVMATREELLQLNKKFDYAGNIQNKQQEQIDRLIMR